MLLFLLLFGNPAGAASLTRALAAPRSAERPPAR
jgi:hypothetical protein